MRRLLKDGFVTREELDEMQAAGAAGEVAGWVFDSEGRYLDFGTNRRTGGVRVEPALWTALHRHCCGRIQGSGHSYGALEIQHHQRLGHRRDHRRALRLA
jgi:hypothetical protein